jgi:SSS family solute:Na+ symporter
MALLFPLVCLVVFFFPVWIGTLGRPLIPGLEGADVDRILPLLMTRLAPSWLGAVVLSGALAALIFTADSQALALGSSLTRDLYRGYLRPRASDAQQLRAARLILAALFVFGFLIALRPVSTLVAITTVAFTGIGVLYPATMAALYWRRATGRAVVSSVLAGEAVSILLVWGKLPAWLSLGSLPIIPGLLVATAVLVLVSCWGSPATAPPGS